VKDTRPRLIEAGIDKDLAKRARKLAVVPPDAFEGGVDYWRSSFLEAGIDKDMADRARKLAAVPDEKFEGGVSHWRGKFKGVRLTSSGLQGAIRKVASGEIVMLSPGDAETPVTEDTVEPQPPASAPSHARPALPLHERLAGKPASWCMEILAGDEQPAPSWQEEVTHIVRCRAKAATATPISPEELNAARETAVTATWAAIEAVNHLLDLGGCPDPCDVDMIKKWPRWIVRRRARNRQLEDMVREVEQRVTPAALKDPDNPFWTAMQRPRVRRN
jgi:hypothetical protein